MSRSDTASSHRIAIIAAYFGPPPPYFSLWLQSCGRNEHIDWLFITDTDVSTWQLPDNVHVHVTSLSKLGEYISAELACEVSLSRPYKLCDFKPAYWLFLNFFNRTYDFWGHCDIDVIFGDLSTFITGDMLNSYDKLFGVGHLTIYRNNRDANLMFQRQHRPYSWRDVFSSDKIFGFDEHHGVNLLWQSYSARVLHDESIVADIDPHLFRFERVVPFGNFSQQVFYVDEGRLFRGAQMANNWDITEFAYIHFQKRALLAPTFDAHSDSYYITPAGFIDKPMGYTPTFADAKKLNGYGPFNWHEFSYRIRRFVRTARDSRRRQVNAAAV